MPNSIIHFLSEMTSEILTIVGIAYIPLVTLIVFRASRSRGLNEVRSESVMSKDKNVRSKSVMSKDKKDQFCYLLNSLIGTFLGNYFTKDLGADMMTRTNLLLYIILFFSLILIVRLNCYCLKVRYGKSLLVSIHLFLIIYLYCLGYITRVYLLSHLGLDCSCFFRLG